MNEIELIIEPEWLIQVLPSCQAQSGMAVVVQADKIIDVLPQALAHQKYQAKQVMRMDGQVLMPGLINLHTHAAMTLMRGLADDQPLMDWLTQHIWPAEQAMLSEEFVYDGSLLACAEMLMGGTTCFNDMYFYPQATAFAAIKSGLRARLGLVVLEFPTRFAHDAEDYIQRGLDARDSWRENALLSACFAPHAPYTVENHTFEKIITFAEQLNLSIHTHLHETADEIRQSDAKYQLTPLQRFKQLGLLGPNLVLAHCVHMQPAEIALLAEYGCHVAHCPNSNLKLASGIAPIHAMTNAGVNVGIGTDGAASNNRLDMFAEMRLAALLAKGASGDATAIPAEQALRMATINAAKALGMEDSIGSIEAGKFADMVAVKLSDIECNPCFDPLSHVVYVAGREHVTHTWVAGVLQYQKLDQQSGVYANIEPIELKEIATKWNSKMRQHRI